MPENTNFSDKQKNAIRSLELSFKKCKEAKLSFVGMDDSLYVIRDIDIPEENSANNIASKNGDLCEKVNDYGRYLDSGSGN